jgi:hypothetical protein
MPVILDYKFYRNGGIMIGLGIGLILAGFLGWLTVSSTYSELQRVLGYSGYNVSNYYFFKDLTDQIAIYLTLMVIGAVAILWSALILKNHAVRELFYSKGPHARLGNSLIGGGGASALGSFQQLFKFILESDKIELDIFIVFFSVGIILLAFGIFELRRKN